MNKIIKKKKPIFKAHIADVFSNKRVNKFVFWIDKFSFPTVLSLWLCLILIFGCVYYFFSSSDAHLIYIAKNQIVNNLADSIYFSFVAATTTGFGDVVPFGWFQVIAILEVVSGLLILAFVTSKLVSIKQDAILNEVYEISFSERINRLRSSLLLFRQSIDRIIGRIEDNSLRARDIASIEGNLPSLEDALNEVNSLVSNNGDKEFLKNVDPLRSELIFNSLNNSFLKIDEFLNLCEKKNINWKKDIDSASVKICVELYDALFLRLSSTKNISLEKLNDLLQTKKSISDSIKKKI